LAKVKLRGRDRVDTVFALTLDEGDGWAELHDDGSLEGEIYLLNGDNIPFIARRSKTSSTAC
jgi:hypothetical protein